MALDPCISCLQNDPTKVHPPTTNLTSPPAPTSPTPFLTKTYELVNDPDTDSVISWSNEGHSFVIWNQSDFSQRLLPRYFKHSNFASFVRQLNTYGFHKIAPDQWEFANVEFQRGQRELLGGIHRRRPSATARPSGPLQADHSCPSSIVFSSCSMVEMGDFDEEDEIGSLKKSKNELMRELLSLQQKLQSTRGDLHTMWERLQTAETYQHHMISFISKAVNNPEFLAQLGQQSSTAAEIANTVPEKRRLVDVDQLATSSINHLCNSTACTRLLSGNHLVLNPHSQQYQTGIKSMETDQSLNPAKVTWNGMRSVNPASLKTLNELVADAKLVRSMEMKNTIVPHSRSFVTEYTHRYDVADGASSRQNYSDYHHVDTRPARGYRHFTAGDARTTCNAGKDLTHNFSNPSDGGNVHLNYDGLESSTPLQQEVRCALGRPCSQGEA